MRPEDLDFLLSPAGRAALDELHAEQLTPTAHLATAEQLRARWGADRAGALLELAQLRQRARAKFARAAEMFFTRDGLEQATACLLYTSWQPAISSLAIYLKINN